MAHIEIARQSARGTLVLFVGNLTATLVAAVASILIARLLGPAGYGVYVLALLVPTVFQLFLGLGVNISVTRFTAYHLARNEPAVAKRVAENAVVFMTLVGILLTLTTLVGSDLLASLLLHRAGLESYVRLASVLVLGQAIMQAATVCYIGYSSMGAVSVATVLLSLLKLALAPSLILLGFGVYGAVTGHVSSVLIAGAIALAFLYVQKLRGVPSDHSSFVGDVRTMVAYGFPAYGGAVVLGFAGQYLTIVLAAIASNSVVGNFQAAVNLTMAITVMSSAITQTLLPAFSGLHGIGGDTGLAMKYAVKYVAFIVAPVIFFLIGAAAPFVLLVYGPSYKQSIYFLQLLSISSIPTLLGMGVVPSLFNAVQKTRYSLYGQLAYAGTTFVTAPLLGIGLGLGAAGLIYSQALSNLAFALLGLYLARKYLKAEADLRSLLAISLTSVIGWATIYFVGFVDLQPLFKLVLEGVLFLSIYLTFAPLFGAIDKDDLVRLEIAIETLSVLKPLVMPILGYEKRMLDLVSMLK